MSYAVDTDQSMKNLVTDFDMVCETKFSIGMIGTIVFLGEAIGSLFYAFFSMRSLTSRANHIIVKNTIVTGSLVFLVILARDTFSLYCILFILGISKSVCMV